MAIAVRYMRGCVSLTVNKLDCRRGGDFEQESACAKSNYSQSRIYSISYIYGSGITQHFPEDLETKSLHTQRKAHSFETFILEAVPKYVYQTEPQSKGVPFPLFSIIVAVTTTVSTIVVRFVRPPPPTILVVRLA